MRIAGWDHAPPRRDTRARLLAVAATLAVYLPLVLLLRQPSAFLTPVGIARHPVEMMMRLLPQPRPRVTADPVFISHAIRPRAVNAPMPQMVIVPARTLSPPALLPVTAADASLLAGGGVAGLGAGAVSGTGTGGNGAGVSGCIDPAYLAAVTRHVGRYFRYPPAAVKNQQSGVAYVHFVIDKTGHASALSLAAGSGQAVLDDYAVALMRQASPVPPIPDRMHVDRLEGVLPIIFVLKGRPEPVARAGATADGC